MNWLLFLPKLASSGPYGPLLARSGYLGKDFSHRHSLTKVFPVAQICPNLQKIVSSSAPGICRALLCRLLRDSHLDLKIETLKANSHLILDLDSQFFSENSHSHSQLSKFFWFSFSDLNLKLSNIREISGYQLMWRKEVPTKPSALLPCINRCYIYVLI